MCLVTEHSSTSPTHHLQETRLRKRDVSNTKTKASSSETISHTEKPIDIVATFENVDCNEVWHYFTKTSVLIDFFNPSKPWVLVPNGSFMGNFDWVPLRFRYGPWHPACTAYLIILTAWVFCECTDGFKNDPFPATNIEQLQAWTLSWYYNVAAFAWTSFMVYNIFCSGMGWTSWGMYTIWSWTATTVRHGACAVAPFKPEWNVFSEQMRFPMLVQATLTFSVWNAVIGPSIYAQMTTPEMKASFRRFFGNFLWRQMHVYNIFFAVVSGIWGSPGRDLTKADFSYAFAFCLLYAYFYVMCLDRVGVHYYLVFSPRTAYALISWTLVFGSYYGCFYMWKWILNKYA